MSPRRSLTVHARASTPLAKARLVSLTALASVVVAACDQARPVASPSDVAEVSRPGVCRPRPSCSGQLPEGTRSPFRHLRSRAAASVGPPTHRGRDQIVKEGDHAFALAKLAYGPTDKDLEDEDVEVYLQTGCEGAFARVATVVSGRAEARTEADGTITGSGRVVTDLGVLPVGRHRVAFVVKGDGSRTDARIDVLAPSARLVVTDVDGTQTTAEYEEVGSVLGGTLPGARPGGAAYLRALADKGYVPFYLTARPEFLTGRTREFLASRGYPPGPVHTTTSLTGALHAAAAAYKTAELAALRRRGLSIAFLLGNRPSDAVAFTTEAEAAERCLLLEVNDPVHGCRTVGAWTELMKEVDDLPSTCP